MDEGGFTAEEAFFVGVEDGNKCHFGDVEALAKEIVFKARELSLIKNRDSPFALLAKENDIMWGGGMPDDCSVVVARISRME